MNMQNLVLIVAELVFRATDHAEIRGCLFSESDRNLVFNKHRVGRRVLHLFKHDALLHLADILLLYHSHQLSELFINKFGTELMVFGETFVHKSIAALL